MTHRSDKSEHDDSSTRKPQLPPPERAPRKRNSKHVSRF
jgi:hypothetical protein